MDTWQIALIVIGGSLALSAITSLGYVDPALIWKKKGPRCRNCGKGDKLYHRQDGGHDYVEGCDHCGAEYGVQDDPFNLVERIR